MTLMNDETAEKKIIHQSTHNYRYISVLLTSTRVSVVIKV